MPKSVTFARPSGSISTFWGFTSRCTSFAGVRGLERAADLDRVRDRLRDRQAPEPPDPVLERLALDVLEDDVGSAVVLAGVDHRHDVRMVQLRHGAGLAPEALELVRVVARCPGASA